MAVYSNTAALSYSYEGSGTLRTQSNTVDTTMTDVYRLTAAKYALPGTYRAGEPVTYLVLVTNAGSEALTGITVADNLGGGLLRYVPGTAYVHMNRTVTAVTPVLSTGEPMPITLPGALAAGDTALVVYEARATATAPLPDITNTVTVAATGAEPVEATATITPEQYASLAIRKAADMTVVAPGDTLNYTLTITNTGTLAAENIRIEDTLPANIAAVNAVYLAAGGGAETTTTNYTYDTATRLFTLPATGTVTVPAADAEGPGELRIRIQATIGAPV